MRKELLLQILEKNNIKFEIENYDNTFCLKFGNGIAGAFYTIDNTVNALKIMSPTLPAIKDINEQINLSTNILKVIKNIMNVFKSYSNDEFNAILHSLGFFTKYISEFKNEVDHEDIKYSYEIIGGIVHFGMLIRE